ncbi:MAG: hypothetical protein CME59_22570 [Halioglobus sp.]|nr:hypothetical protein [Halioglobus sp.]|tara:strand:+ start:42 stop:353 length:312 start_codon:yes stop_codon:yes gene_type:complete
MLKLYVGETGTVVAMVRFRGVLSGLSITGGTCTLKHIKTLAGATVVGTEGVDMPEVEPGHHRVVLPNAVGENIVEGSFYEITVHGEISGIGRDFHAVALAEKG